MLSLPWDATKASNISMRTLFLPQLCIGFSQEWFLMRDLPYPFTILQPDLKQDEPTAGEHLPEQVLRPGEAELRSEAKDFWGKRSWEERRKSRSWERSRLLVYLVEGLEKRGDSRYLKRWDRLNLLRKGINDLSSEYTFSKTCEISIFHKGNSHSQGHIKSASPLKCTSVLKSACEPAKGREEGSLAHCKIGAAGTADVLQPLWEPGSV